MKVFAGILKVLVLLFSVTAAYAAVAGQQFAEYEATIARRIRERCSFAEKADESGLRALETLLAEEVTNQIAKEKSAHRSWLGNSMDRKSYLKYLAIATYIIESNSRVVQCIEARRISITTPTPYLNVCGTNQGPLGCAGQFTGLYQSRCFDPVATSDHGSGTLTVFPDGKVSLKLQSIVHGTGGSDEVSGIMDRTGLVIIDQSSPERKIRYDGRFTVQSEPSRRLSGGGTYIYRSSAVSCDGQFRLHDY